MLTTTMEGTSALLEQLVEVAKREGASLMGVAPVERFDGAPRGHHPRNFVPNAKSVVVFGCALLPAVVDWQHLLDEIEEYDEPTKKGTGQNWFYTAAASEIPGQLLELTAMKAAMILQNDGYRSLFFPPTNAFMYADMRQWTSGLFAPFSHRHAAVRAGLGEFGLLNLVVTPQYGPRCRFTSVITEAELPPSPLVAESVCLGSSCSLCVEACVGKALIPDADTREGEVRIDPVSRTDKKLCTGSTRNNFCRGVCLSSCPIGQGGWGP